jgi:hypothetical protein
MRVIGAAAMLYLGGLSVIYAAWAVAATVGVWSWAAGWLSAWLLGCQYERQRVAAIAAPEWERLRDEPASLIVPIRTGPHWWQ